MSQLLSLNHFAFSPATIFRPCIESSGRIVQRLDKFSPHEGLGSLSLSLSLFLSLEGAYKNPGLSQMCCFPFSNKRGGNGKVRNLDPLSCVSLELCSGRCRPSLAQPSSISSFVGHEEDDEEPFLGPFFVQTAREITCISIALSEVVPPAISEYRTTSGTAMTLKG